VVAGLSAAAALLVVLVAVVASIGYVTTSHARHRAEIALAGETTARCNTERQLLRAEWLLYASNIKSAWRELEANDLVVASHYLDSCRADFRGWEYDYLQTLVSKNQLKGHSGAVSSVAFSPDGKRIVSGSDDNTLRVWDAATGQETLVLKGSVGAHMLLLSGTTDPNAGVTCVVFSSDGKRIVGGNRDGTLDDLGLDATGKAEPGEDVRHFRQEIPPTESG
jgi:WD40 repeat protein